MSRNNALLADIACWSLLTYLLYAVGWYPLATAVGIFAVIYNTRNLRTVTRGWLSNRRYRKDSKIRDEVRRELRNELYDHDDIADIADERIDRYIRRRKNATGR